MRSINLIPPEERRGAGGIAGRTGGLVYVLIATLIVLVALGVVYVSAVSNAASSKTTLAQVTSEAAIEQSQVAALQPYVSFEGVSQQRIASIASLAYQRFNWPDAMEQLALSLPKGVWLTSLSGSASGGGATTTTTPAATTGTTSAAGATGSSGVLGTTVNAPTLSLVGCAPSQDAVAATLSRLRQLRYVSDVQLSTYTRSGCPKVSFDMTAVYANDYAIAPPKLSTGANSTVGG